MANPEASRSPSPSSIITPSVSRREALTGIAGLAGVAAAPLPLAARGCGHQYSIPICIDPCAVVFRKSLISVAFADRRLAERTPPARTVGR